MSKTHSVLIVDDEPDVLFSLTGLLRRDFNVHTAASGKEALAIMREHSINVIMTDQRMPSMTGSELMEMVRNDHPDAIRIIFTGYADTRAVVDAINRGELYRYITKPWDPDDLLEVLRDAAARYDALAARADLLKLLGGYLDDAHQLGERCGPSTLPEPQWQRFREQTQTLRELHQQASTAIYD
ncbi:response regulator [Roseimaritima sediminicola]|uniref:response regulator n=1 Tax=Roseimaritima sediminicola TaxID=2662066 RepID=UPI001386B6F1|nr:response regulator [Roseimaritima sediminicola]